MKHPVFLSLIILLRNFDNLLSLKSSKLLAIVNLVNGLYSSEVISNLLNGGIFMSIGIWQIVLILAIVLILFGAGKLPRVMGDVAKGIKNFKTGMKEEEDTEEASAKETVSVSKDKDNNTDSKAS